MSLYAEHGYSFREYSLEGGLVSLQAKFVSSNLIFYSFLGVDLVFGLWLVSLVQFSSDYCSSDCDLLNVLVVAPALFGLYSIFEITSLF